MFHISNFTNNDDINVLDSMGPFTVIEYARDLSVAPTNAMAAYFCNAMNVRKRQVMCDLSQANVTVQSGAMQWMVGNVKATTGIKGVGDLLGKAVRGKVTGESAIKPEYTGDGVMVLEPTYKHIILLDVDEWNGSVVLDDGMFLACDANLRHKAVMRSTLSSAAAGNEGLFNLGIVGSGVLCLESPCPKEELVEVTLRDDVIKIDGNMAVAWSGSLDFTVERSGRSLMGSAVSGEGLVNVYRGTGKVLFAPVSASMSARMALRPSIIFSASCSSMMPCLPSMAAWAMEPAMSSLYIRASKAMEELKSLTRVSVSFWNRPAQSFIVNRSYSGQRAAGGRPLYKPRRVSAAGGKKIRIVRRRTCAFAGHLNLWPQRPQPPALCAGEGGIAGIVPPTREAR